VIVVTVVANVTFATIVAVVTVVTGLWILSEPAPQPSNNNDQSNEANDELLTNAHSWSGMFTTGDCTGRNRERPTDEISLSNSSVVKLVPQFFVKTTDSGLLWTALEGEEQILRNAFFFTFRLLLSIGW